MKRAIAMKCNQEQWDAIKDKLVGCRPFRIEPFEKDFYLALYNDKSITNGTIMFDNDKEVHETWNEQIFLEACGIETVFKGSELQVRS